MLPFPKCEERESPCHAVPFLSHLLCLLFLLCHSMEVYNHSLQNGLLLKFNECSSSSLPQCFLVPNSFIFIHDLDHSPSHSPCSGHTGLASSSACQTPAQNRTSACSLFSTQNVLDLPMDEIALPQDLAWIWSIFQSLPKEILSEIASTSLLSLSNHVNRFPFILKYLP